MNKLIFAAAAVAAMAAGGAAFAQSAQCGADPASCGEPPLHYSYGYGASAAVQNPGALPNPATIAPGTIPGWIFAQRAIPYAYNQPYVLPYGNYAGRYPRYAPTARDRDGDGIPNRRDRYPLDPGRY